MALPGIQPIDHFEWVPQLYPGVVLLYQRDEAFGGPDVPTVVCHELHEHGLGVIEHEYTLVV